MKDDLISRQAAIDACMRVRDLRAYDEIEEIKALPSAQPMRWILCSEVTGEGYPKEDGFYYVTERNYGFYLDADYKQNVAHISHFFNGDFTDRFYDENHSNIVAWMPLPEPYKMDEVGK